MFQCWHAGVSIFLSQIEMKSVPTNQLIASRETSPQLESSVLLRETEAPQSLMGLGLFSQMLLSVAKLHVNISEKTCQNATSRIAIDNFPGFLSSTCL